MRSFVVVVVVVVVPTVVQVAVAKVGSTTTYHYTLDTRSK